MTWTFTLPIDLPSANRHGGAATNARHAANAAMYRRQRATWVALLKAEAMRLAIPRILPTTVRNLRTGTLVVEHDTAVPHRAVTIVRLWAKGCRAWDDDNLVAACKGLRDAMQRERVSARKGQVPRLIAGAGLVWDDSAKWSRWTYAQRKSDDGQPGVLITITDEPRSDA